MAKTSMVEREKRREKTVLKYAAKRAELKELIRSPQTSDEARAEAQRKLQLQPRDASQSRVRNRCAADRQAARRVPQIRVGPYQDPRSSKSRRNPRPRQGELVGGVSKHEHD